MLVSAALHQGMDASAQPDAQDLRVAALVSAALHQGVQYVQGLLWDWLIAAPIVPPFIEVTRPG